MGFDCYDKHIQITAANFGRLGLHIQRSGIYAGAEHLRTPKPILIYLNDAGTRMRHSRSYGAQPPTGD